MLMALSLLYISLSMLIPTLDMIMQMNKVDSLKQKVHAEQIIKFHNNMVIYCQKQAQICNRSKVVDFDKPYFQNDNLYKNYLTKEVYNSSIKTLLHAYSFEGRYFTTIGSQGGSSKGDDVENLYLIVNSYAPKYIGVGQSNCKRNNYNIKLFDGSLFKIDRSLCEVIGKNTYVLVS